MKTFLPKTKTLTVLLVLITLLLLPGLGWGQQVIGSFPSMDGGFENQTGTLATVSTLNSAQSYWTTAIAAAGVISNTNGRSGPKYVTYSQSGTSHRRLQSPTADIPTGSYVVQFYYQGDLDGGTYGDIRGSVSSNGSASPAYGSYVSGANTGAVWTKYSAVVSPGIYTANIGIGIVSVNNTAQFKIDDFVVYAGSSADVTSANSPGAVTVDGATQTSLNVGWAAASGGYDGGGYVVVRFGSDPGTGNDPNQNGIYAVGNTVAAGGTVRYIGTGTSFTDNVGLSAGTQYWYKVYTVDKAFNYSDESSNSGTTTSPSGSTSSDIIGAGNETANIAYATYQASSITTTSDAVRVFSFTIRDGGGSADGDALPTILASVTFDKGAGNGVTNWANTLREAALFDGSTKIAEVSVTGETIIFTGLSGANVTAADDGNKTLDLYVTFESAVTDNQQFQFQITNANVTNAVSGSSSFTTFGAVLSNVTGDANRLEVTASKLAFVQQPTGVALNIAISPAVTVAANDANNNRDLDYTSDVTITATGATLTGSPVSATSVVAGLATFSSLTFTTAGTGVVLNAASGSLTGATSSPFDITQPPTVGEIVINQFSPDYSGAADEYVELLNKTNKSFDLSLLKIEYQSSGGSGGGAGGNLTGTIGPYEYWLLSPNATITVGLTVALSRDGFITSGFAGSAGQFALQLKNSPNTIIDGLAYGTITGNNLGEGTAASSPPTHGGLIRIVDGEDNNVNSTDFTTITQANIYLRNHNSINVTSDYTLPSLFYPADVWLSNTSFMSLSGNTTISGKLTILSGSLTIASDQGLTVNGAMTNAVGDAGIYIESNATSTGSLIHSTASVPATVERYMTGGWSAWNTGWHQISSPVASQAISGFATGSYDFYGWDETSSLWMNYKAAGFSTWNGGINFNVGQGYLISYDATNTKTFSGNLNVANVPLSNLSKGGVNASNNGWHLLGNPFASAIKWNNGNWALSNVAGGAKIWHEGNKSYSDIAANGIIPSAQGFMIQVSSATNSITIPAASRTHDATAWYKSTAENQRFLLVASETEGGSAQESQLIVNPMATDAFDFEFDSRFLAGFAPMFYSLVGTEMLSTNSIPTIGAESAIPFGFVKNAASTFAIELKEQIDGQVVYLTDKKTSTLTNLSQTPVYSFTASEGDDANRFTLHFSTVGIDNPTTGEAVQVYAHNGLVYINGASANAEVTLVDITGRVVLRSRTAGNSLTTLNVSNLPHGMYIVKINSGKELLSRKIIL